MKTHKMINDITKQSIEGTSMKLHCKLGEILTARGITQTELSILTGIRQASINDMIHNRKYTINTQHLIAIMLALKLTDLSAMYEIEIDYHEKVKLQDERIEAEMVGILQEQVDIIQSRKKEKGLES